MGARAFVVSVKKRFGGLQGTLRLASQTGKRHGDVVFYLRWKARRVVLGAALAQRSLPITPVQVLRKRISFARCARSWTPRVPLPAAPGRSTAISPASPVISRWIHCLEKPRSDLHRQILCVENQRELGPQYRRICSGVGHSCGHSDQACWQCLRLA